MKYCISCGASLPDETAYCIKCGAPQPGAKHAAQAPAQPAPAVQQQYYTPRQAPTPQAWIQCRHCNAMLPISPTVPCYQCPVCGNPLSAAPNTQPRWAVGHVISIISILAVFIGEFLPFLTISVLGISNSVQIWSETFAVTAFITTFLLSCSLLLTAFDKNSKGKFAFVSALLILLLIYDNYSSNQTRLSNVDAGLEEWGLGKINASGMLQPGFGLYLMIIGCLGMIAGAIALHMRRRN